MNHQILAKNKNAFKSGKKLLNYRQNLRLKTFLGKY